MFGGRKVRSNKGKKRGPYKSKTHTKILLTPGGSRHIKQRKVRSNKGKKRTPYGPRTGKTRSGKRFRLTGGWNPSDSTDIRRELTTTSGKVIKEPIVISIPTKEKLGVKLRFGKKDGPEVKSVSKGLADKKGVKKKMHVMGVDRCDMWSFNMTGKSSKSKQEKNFKKKLKSKKNCVYFTPDPDDARWWKGKEANNLRNSDYKELKNSRKELEEKEAELRNKSIAEAKEKKNDTELAKARCGEDGCLARVVKDGACEDILWHSTVDDTKDEHHMYGDIYHGSDGKKCKGKTETFEYFGPVRHGVPHGEDGIFTTYTYNQKKEPSGKFVSTGDFYNGFYHGKVCTGGEVGSQNCKNWEEGETK